MHFFSNSLPSDNRSQIYATNQTVTNSHFAVELSENLDGFSGIELDDSPELFAAQRRPAILPEKNPNYRYLSLTNQEREIVQNHKFWKKGKPLFATQQDIEKEAKRRKFLVSQDLKKLPKLSQKPPNCLFERKLQEKIEEARSNASPLLLKLESSDSRIFNTSRTKVVETKSAPDLLSLLHMSVTQKPSRSRESKPMRTSEVISRKHKLMEEEQREKLEAYRMHHENRRRKSSIARLFDVSKRQRFFLLLLFHSSMVHALLKKKKITNTAPGKLYQRNQNDLFKQSVKRILRQNKKTTRLLSRNFSISMFTLSLCVRFIGWFQRFRKRRGIQILEKFLNTSKYSPHTIMRLYARIKNAALIIQRSIRSFLVCQKARLSAMHLLVAKVFRKLKEEAQMHKKTYKGWPPIPAHKIPHPKHKIDMNQHFDEHITTALLINHIKGKRVSLVNEVNILRKTITRMGFSTVQSWLNGDRASFQEHQDCLKVGTTKKIPFPHMLLYTKTTLLEIVELLQTVLNPATRLRHVKPTLSVHMRKFPNGSGTLAKTR